MRVLSRERFEPNESMQKGIDLENRIQAWCAGQQEMSLDDMGDAVAGIGELCKGGGGQVPIKREFDGFLLYGRADVIKQDTIIDIKYSGSYDLGKYQPSAQHRIYLLCTDLPKFAYVISDGRSWWREDYANHANNEVEVRALIREFIGYLKNDPEAAKLYKEKWQSF